MTDLPTTAKRWRADSHEHCVQRSVDAELLADFAASLLDETPLTLDAIKAAGWERYLGAYRKPGTILEAWFRYGKCELFMGSIRLIDNATLGDLRSLERILSREEPTK